MTSLGSPIKYLRSDFVILDPFPAPLRAYKLLAYTPFLAY